MLIVGKALLLTCDHAPNSLEVCNHKNIYIYFHVRWANHLQGPIFISEKFAVNDEF